MPGFIPHFLAGHFIFLLSYGILYSYTSLEKTTNNTLLLYSVCIIFSIIPDFPLGLFYILNIGTFSSLLQYHALLHKIISPLAVSVFIVLSVFNIIRKKQIWIVGVFCIILHIFLDATIEEMGVWI